MKPARSKPFFDFVMCMITILASVAGIWMCAKTIVLIEATEQLGEQTDAVRWRVPADMPSDFRSQEWSR